MSLTLLENPRRTVNGIDSNVIGAKSQIPLKFLRVDAVRDYGPSYQSPVGEPIGVFFGNVDDLQDSKIGDRYFIDFPEVYPPGIYTQITDPVQFLEGSWQITFDLITTQEANVNGVNTQYLSLRPNYVVSLQVTNTATGLPILPAPLNFKPLQDGNLFVDLHDIFFGFDFFGQSLQFTVDYEELWTGEGGGFADSGSTPEIVGLSGFKQLQQSGGSNMWEFLPNIRQVQNVERISLASGGNGRALIDLDIVNTEFNIGDFLTYDIKPYKKTTQVLDADVGVTVGVEMDDTFKGEIQAGAGHVLGTIHRPGGRFLTTLKRGVHWLYWRRTVSFVIDSNLLARTGSATLNFVLIGRNATGANIFTEITPHSGAGLVVKQFPLVEEVATWETFLTVGLLSDVGSERLLFDQQKACSNPIMIEWENREGAPEQHLFSINQAIQTISPEGLVFEQPILNTLDQVTTAVGRLPLGETQLITLTAEELTIDQLKSLRFMKESGHVALFLDQAGTKQISVAIVENLITPYETRAGLYSFTCIIRLPKNFEFESID